VRRSGLGRGLGALIPADAGGDVTSILQDLPIGAVEPNPNQPRVSFDEAALDELTASIQALGVLQPVLVRPLDEGRYQLIAGERRWRAARRAGLDTIPAVIRDTDDVGAVEQALVENIQREELHALEEAAAYQQLIEDFELTHDEVARRVGRSRVAVTNTLRLLQLPPSIQHLVAERRLSAGHARALLGTPDRAFQEALARRAVSEELTVREVEEAVRQRVLGHTPTESEEAPAPRRPGLRPPGLLELEDLLSDYLDTRVKVAMGSRRGKVTVEFATLEDLERIYRLITEPPPSSPG
jgi:ParB family transcriptional regulator, chromosome partitioning protein